MTELHSQYIEALQESASQSEARQLPRPSEDVPRAGDIWSLRGKAGTMGFSVLLLPGPSGAMRGLLVVEDLWLATDEDVLFRSPANGEPDLLVCLWREMPLSLSTLWASHRKVPLTTLNSIMAARCRRLEPITTTEATIREHLGLLWQESVDEVDGTGWITGLPPLQSDPVWAVRNEIVQFTSYIEAQALEELDALEAGEGIHTDALSALWTLASQTGQGLRELLGRFIGSNDPGLVPARAADPSQTIHAKSAVATASLRLDENGVGTLSATCPLELVVFARTPPRIIRIGHQGCPATRTVLVSPPEVGKAFSIYIEDVPPLSEVTIVLLRSRE